MDQAPRVETMVGDGYDQRYWPINQYGVIGDCRTAALIAPNGSVDWCCLPHFDSPAAFCRLLDADRGGYYRLCPTGPSKSSMAYLPGTNILETIFSNQQGRVRLVDFAPIRKREPKPHILEELGALITRAPHGLAAGLEREVGNDVAAAHRITRMLTCLEGEMPVELTLNVTFDYARQETIIERQMFNDDSVSAVLTTPGHDRFLVLVVEAIHPHEGDLPPLTAERDRHILHLRTTVRAGNGLIAHLNYARTQEEAETLLAQLRTRQANMDLEETLDYWREWSAICKYTGTYQHAVTRSALALKLCTFEPTGAIVAAPTTSLPEAIGGERNWDYRYTWLRDSAFTLDALGRLGYMGEARDYVHFLHDLQIQSGSDIRIMYGIRGERGAELAEHELSHLEGYRGSRPVRIGNGAATQQQLDIYGELLDAACRYVQHAGFRNHVRSGPDRDLRVLSATITNYVMENWQKLDRGIWEVRGEPRAFVYSRAMCWVALDRACRMAEHHGHHRERHRWEAAKEAIHEDVLQHGFDQELQSFVQAYGTKVLDAANLRLPLAGFLPWDDSRIARTVTATKRELSMPQGLVYRYRPAGAAKTPDTKAGKTSPGGMGGEPADDGLSGKEGSFLACAFWMVENLCYLGKVEEARERFESLLHFTGPLGLFAEELDPDSGEQVGNYPQAFTHIGLINSAVTLQQAQEGTLYASIHANG